MRQSERWAGRRVARHARVMVGGAGVWSGGNKLGVPVRSRDRVNGEDELELADGRLGGPEESMITTSGSPVSLAGFKRSTVITCGVPLT